MQNTKFGLPPCSYLLDLGAKMIKYCNERILIISKYLGCEGREIIEAGAVFEINVRCKTMFGETGLSCKIQGN